MPQQFLRKAYIDDNNVLTASRTYANGVSYFLLIHSDDVVHQE